MPEEIRYYDIPEVAKLIRVSARWLADECRAGRVEHVHIARKRRFTAAQVETLMAANTVKAAPTPVETARTRAEKNLRRRMLP
ncbi:helix-turn-helix domain-containing protein [Dactylosporangium salmoneum]|uniref:Helix-turn-helix domain-containing protein n=1 Tax=Dactylosporangium salmoneum TaxID=53361 RepID=A0ABN3H504_9ACTN